jgi:hypothetical protein
MESERREIVEVALRIFNTIPDEELSFKKAMKKFIYDDMAYMSPERRNNQITWHSFSIIMHTYITNGDSEWKQECIDIFTAVK